VKKIFTVLFIALTMSGLHGQNLVENSHRTWIRRVTFIAACAASIGFDTLSTRHAVSSGAVESNGLLAGPQGAPAWGRMIGIKIGLSAATVVLEETHVFGRWKSPNADWTWTAVNSGTASLYTWAGFHNLDLPPSK